MLDFTQSDAKGCEPKAWERVQHGTKQSLGASGPNNREICPWTDMFGMVDGVEKKGDEVCEVIGVIMGK
jgi:hypothetical protein